LKQFILMALALAACTPQPPSASAPTADPLAVRYEVRIGQAVLPNVRSVSIDGPDIELVEFRQGGQPQGAVTLTTGRVGMIKLVIRTDWAAAEQTMETWRATLTGAAQTPTLASVRRTITIAITSPGATAPATYAFQRCLPSEHDMQLAEQDSRIEQVWRATCESVQRS
jgi:hypothetical protein